LSAKRPPRRSPAKATWSKLPVLPGKNNPCLHGPPILPVLELDAVIAVGFGSAGVSRDGETVWEEQQGEETGDYWQCSDAEAAAAKDPDHDWRITFHGPLHGETYQRQGKAQWVLVQKTEGFA
jgi:hypothetical protein